MEKRRNYENDQLIVSLAMIKITLTFRDEASAKVGAALMSLGMPTSIEVIRALLPPPDTGGAYGNDLLNDLICMDIFKPKDQPEKVFLIWNNLSKWMKNDVTSIFIGALRDFLHAKPPCNLIGFEIGTE